MTKKSRNTIQKELLEKNINKMPPFFTADDLFSKVKDENIGIATIYRFLKEKTKHHLLHSYICEKKTVYSKQKTNHCHFACQICKKSFHFDTKNIDFLKKNLKAQICHFQIDVTGVCEECLKNDNSDTVLCSNIN